MALSMSLKKSFSIQCRVIWAVLLREVLTRYGRHNIGFIWLFIEPMMFTLGVTALWKLKHSFLEGHAQVLGVPLIPFVVTGYSTVLMWRNVSNRSAGAIASNYGLLHHRNVRVLDLAIARILLEATGVSISFLIITSLLTFLGLIDLPADLLTLLIGWLLLAWFALGVGMILIPVTEKSETFDRLWHTFTYLFLPFCGAFFMVSWLPLPAQKLVMYVPIVTATEMIRHGYFGDSVKTFEDPAYLIAWNICLTLIGLLLLKKFQKDLAAP